MTDFPYIALEAFLIPEEMKREVLALVRASLPKRAVLVSQIKINPDNIGRNQGEYLRGYTPDPESFQNTDWTARDRLSQTPIEYELTRNNYTLVDNVAHFTPSAIARINAKTSKRLFTSPPPGAVWNGVFSSPGLGLENINFYSSPAPVDKTNSYTSPTPAQIKAWQLSEEKKHSLSFSAPPAEFGIARSSGTTI